MRYLIKETTLQKAIYNFINDEFYDDNLDWEYDIDVEGDGYEQEKNILCFSGDRFREREQDDWTFQYVKKGYYENLEDKEFANKWIDKAPILEFMDKNKIDKMDNLFGNQWKPIFENWFKRNYPEFPVKTFLYPSIVRKFETNEGEVTEKCWKGYTQKGMKTMFGKRYPNCVKKTK